MSTKKKYDDLTKLLASWLYEENDHDNKYWKEIAKRLLASPWHKLPEEKPEEDSTVLCIWRNSYSQQHVMGIVHEKMIDNLEGKDFFWIELPVE